MAAAVPAVLLVVACAGVEGASDAGPGASMELADRQMTAAPTSLPTGGAQPQAAAQPGAASGSHAAGSGAARTPAADGDVTHAGASGAAGVAQSAADAADMLSGAAGVGASGMSNAGAGLMPVAGEANAAASGDSGTGGAGVGGRAGSTPAGSTADMDQAAQDITVWIAGDSTVAKGNTPCPVGWGAEFQALFKPKVKVVNSAVGGRSVRTWLYEVQKEMDSSGECVLTQDGSGEPVLQARWQQMLDAMSGMQPGDYLFIQFGINDSSATCERHVGLAAFQESYGMMAEAAKTRGAQAVFVTPVSAIACSGTTARATRGSFVTATIEAAERYDVPVIDLHERSIALYNQLGLCPIPGGGDVSAATGGKVGSFFCDDHTHFDREGAVQIAQLMADALQEQHLGLAAYLEP